MAAGTEVTFTNNDTVNHTVTSDAGQVESFDGGALAPGTKLEQNLGTAGTIGIHCTIHTGMTATVIVQQW